MSEEDFGPSLAIDLNNDVLGEIFRHLDDPVSILHLSYSSKDLYNKLHYLRKSIKKSEYLKILTAFGSTSLLFDSLWFLSLSDFETILCGIFLFGDLTLLNFLFEQKDLLDNLKFWKGQIGSIPPALDEFRNVFPSLFESREEMFTHFLCTYFKFAVEGSRLDFLKELYKLGGSKKDSVPWEFATSTYKCRNVELSLWAASVE